MSSNTAVAFLVGAVLGAGVTYLCMKGKVDAEISDVRESLSEDLDKKEELKAQKAVEKEDIFKIAKTLIADNSYSYSEPSKETIYTIEPDIAGEDGYTLMNFVYHTDGIITDDENNPVDNVPKHLGINYLQLIKDAAGDFVYIRNEDQKLDYEVEKSDKAYSYIDEEPHKIGKRHIDFDDYFEDEEE